MSVKPKGTTTNIRPAKLKATSAAKPLPDLPAIDLIRNGTCSTISGKSTLTYELGTAPEGAFCYRITANTGGGMFNPEWISWIVLEPALKAISPLTSFHMRKLFKGKSTNNAGFLTAILLREGILESSPDKKRHYLFTGKPPSSVAPAPMPEALPADAAKPSKKSPTPAKKSSAK